MIETRLETSSYEVVYTKGATRPKGWITRDLLQPDKPRNLVLFSGSYRDLLSSRNLQLLDDLAKRVQQIQAGGGILKTGAVKHLVNEIFEGRSQFPRDSGVTVALYKFGPVPAVVFDHFRDYQLAVYPFFPGRNTGRAYPADRYNKLLAYNHCGIDLLFAHYFEHIGARFHDIEWFRSFIDSIVECMAIRKEISESVFGKLNEIEEGAKGDEASVRDTALPLVENHRRALYVARYASYFALDLVTQFCKLFGISVSDWDYDVRLQKIHGDAEAFQDDGNVRGLSDGWVAFSTGNRVQLEALERAPVSTWVSQMLSFARFLLGLKQRILEWHGPSRLGTTPACFASFHFEARNAAEVARITALLPSELRNRNIPLNLIVGTAGAGEDLEDVIRQKIFLSDVLMPFIPPRDDEHQPRRYDWIIREIDHACLTQKRVVFAIAHDGDKDTLLSQLRGFRGPWLSTDFRIPEDRAKSVEEKLSAKSLRFADVGPNAVDQNLLTGIQTETLELAEMKIRLFLRQFLWLMDEPVRRWTIFMLLEAGRYPENKHPIIRKMIGQRIIRNAKKFDTLRALQNKRKIVMGSSERGLIEFDPSLGKYRSNLGKLMGQMGLSERTASASQLASVRANINLDLNQMLNRAV